MKKIPFLFLSFIATASAYAQTISYGIKAGLNLTEFPSTLYFFSSPGNVSRLPIDEKYRVGFHIGVVANVKFDWFSIEPGILFTTKGSRMSYSISQTINGETVNTQDKLTMTLNYIEIPLNFLYNLPVMHGTVFIGGGPYIGIGLSGSGTDDSNINGKQTSNKLAFGFGSAGYHNPRDLGINALLGFRLSARAKSSLGYGYGITNLNRLGKSRNEGFSLSAAYFIK